MALPRSIAIVEVGPRDGLQNEAASVPTEVKIEFIRRAVDAGIRRIEVASFVSPRRVPQMADAEAILKALPRRDDVTYVGLVLNRAGFDRAAAAGCREIGMVVFTTDEFNRRNQGVTSAESVRIWREIAAVARDAGIRAQVTISAAFGCPFEGEVPAQRVVNLARELAESAPFEVAIADTIGVGVPGQVTDIFGRVAEAVPGMTLRGHFHNTRNTGIANAYAAVMAGARVLDASLGGLGGWPFLRPDTLGRLARKSVPFHEVVPRLLEAHFLDVDQAPAGQKVDLAQKL